MGIHTALEVLLYFIGASEYFIGASECGDVSGWWVLSFLHYCCIDCYVFTVAIIDAYSSSERVVFQRIGDLFLRSQKLSQK